ncbi:hypothetical protein EHI8A_068040 [Entamoeba histolytica HM-1:IMSS-B]|uniref:C2H2-type domain-containing protein n=4 Tax=Entamoeba histolytica TaxID=5759 RepID=C4LZA7_ENTH1|nr:hypothetical protein EHI_000560 [Entamoeba histolytica HM-1:IMSS]EAL47801.1 hypothetical protein EHI_000560 [Entamoeba histolytica HM-1:IMSS]EMH72085.1 hypothetical protein EHI8A_068040 [Entamoeba histolytica HM-1:IMSS-B]ENY62225.1 zinc finger protein matrin-type protein, putative [Entamoeba histolytica HM-1:IMSS-A]GAT94188.1 hypothetical protein CL6EHI_000560 [Entamoeba histolytica]|eukprot:XP_653187.1 hypothetical protein EHI_000560 [Entamoeba histolytica HM-1:IMSS]
MTLKYTLDKSGRRKWNKELYANEYFEGKWNGEEENSQLPSREESLKLINKKGSTILTKKQGRLYCTICKKMFSDSTSFTTHLNLPEHIEKAGIETNFKTPTVDDIKTKLQLLQEKKREEKETPEEKEYKRLEWKASRKERKREWKKRQQQTKENDPENQNNERSRSNSRTRTEK